jgi:hypothetical protein
MTDRNKDEPLSDKPTKPAQQDVGPPEERVDDEGGSDEPKTTKRQE